MKALILAAGVGSRLRPITNSRPKAMVEVNGKPIIFYQIDSLLENGLKDITIVTGYKSEFIIESVNKVYSNINYIVNEEFEKSNNMYSTYLARNTFYNKDFILMNADVVIDSSIISDLINSSQPNSILVDYDQYNLENMKVTFSGKKIISISKDIASVDSNGLSIDIYKISKNASILFFDIILDYIENQSEKTLWTEVAINRTLGKIDFFPCPFIGRWIEIDDHYDLKRAEDLFNGC